MDNNTDPFTTADPDSGAYRDPEVYQTLTATRTGVTLSGGTVWRVDSNEVGFVGEYVGDEACEALAQAWEDVA